VDALSLLPSCTRHRSDRTALSPRVPNAGAARRELDADAETVQRRLTVCQLAEVAQAVGGTDEHYSGIGIGISMCHPSDVFTKRVGRKKSFTYALEAASRDGLLSREERRDLWNGYFKPVRAVTSAQCRGTGMSVLSYQP
jgi:hypothetical protein